MMRFGGGVVERAFEAVADFDAQLAVLFMTSSSTPSFTPLRPSFHCSATRSAYCSIVSGFTVGTISTANWAPFAFERRQPPSGLVPAGRASAYW